MEFSMLDWCTFFVQNNGAFMGCSCAGIIIGIATYIAMAEENVAKKFYIIPLSICIILVSAGLISSFIPSHDKILRVKIAKIKNEAVSKQNIDSGLETLERISKKLECKYLGCKGVDEAAQQEGK